jgi:hypothetical protein
MNLTISQLQLMLAVASLASQAAVMVVMAKRGLRSKFPMFFTYAGLNILAIAVVMTTYFFALSQYFYVYWTLSTLVMIVGFVVQYEVFVDLLKPFSAVIDLGKTLFIWAALFLFLAGLLTAMVTSGPSPKKIVVVVDLCDRCIHLMQCGLLMLLVCFEKRLNFSWRSPGMAVALGLGFLAAVDLVVSYGQGRFPARTLQFEMLYGLTYIAVTTSCAFALRSSKLAIHSISSTPSRLILQRWDEALIGYGYGERAATSTVESFLPGIEKTVDRVMARKAVS